MTSNDHKRLRQSNHSHRWVNLAGLPVLETCQFMSMREYISAELGELGNRYRQEEKESIAVWMLYLWDSGAKVVFLVKPHGPWRKQANALYECKS